MSVEIKNKIVNSSLSKVVHILPYRVFWVKLNTQNTQFTQNTQAMFLGKGQQNIQGGIGVITVLHRIDK